jgi:mycothiol S-conjugate amidase
MHEKFLELGLESPYTDERFQRALKAEAEPPPAHRAVVDVTGYASVTRESLLAHATQVDPNSRHWFGLPPDVADNVHPWEEYEVARDLTGSEADGDLFAGVDSVHAA